MVATLVAILCVTDTSYDTYFAGAQFVHFLLGPATVALAVPLYANLPAVRRLAMPLLISLTVGSCVAILSAVMIAQALGVSRPVLFSLAPKSVTSPVAMGLAEQIGGIHSRTAVLVILTGVTGAVLAPGLLRLHKGDRPLYPPPTEG